MVRQLIASAVLGWCCAAQAATAPVTPVHDVPEKQAHATAELARTAMYRVIDLQLNDSNLMVAIDRLRDLAPGVPIFVNWKSLEAAGIHRNHPVSLDLKGVHTSTALDLLLRVASPEGPRLGWVLDEGVITVSTVEDLNKNVIIQVYDIRDLFPKDAPASEHHRRAAALIKFVSNRIEPASWKTHGGAVGAVRELNGQLIVTQTPENQRTMIDLIQGLKQLAAPK